ncbi:MAG: hypothetical protein JJ896_01405 [Rhodothermales bacterium]|nr:hypothetical protein [Rhodothermales bacterium]MBO6778285.1 hypothetical protein [Rhodothermales bacterium]
MKAILLAAVLMLTTTVVQAQPAPDDWPEPAAADVESVDAIMAAVYDVISGPAGPRDWDRFRSLFRPEAKLIPIARTPDGNYPVYMGVNDYVERAGGQFNTMGFFEREISRTQEQYGSMVHLFSTYEARRAAEDPEPFMRGINSFQLFNDGSRWWVVNIYWLAESPDTPIPDAYLDN